MVTIQSWRSSSVNRNMCQLKDTIMVVNLVVIRILNWGGALKRALEAPTCRRVWGHPPPEMFEILKLRNASFVT